MEKLRKEQLQLVLFIQVNFTASAREEWISAGAAEEALEKGLFTGMC